MATSFKDIKDGNDKDAAKIFVTKVLPLYVPTVWVCLNCLLTLELAFLLCFTSGSLRLFLSLLRGWRVDWRMGGRLLSCRWLGSFLGSLSLVIEV